MKYIMLYVDNKYLATAVFYSASTLSSIDHNGKNWMIDPEIAADKYYHWSVAISAKFNTITSC